jgi:BlaI family penicillinase repressor
LHEAVNPPAAYSTVRKLLQISAEKGLIRRISDKKPCVYEAAYSEDQTQQHLLSGIVQKVFGGSPSRLVMQVLASRKTSAKHLAEIQRIVEKHKKN